MHKNRKERLIIAASSSYIKRNMLETNRKKQQNLENKNENKNNWPTKGIALDMTWIWLRRGNLKKETGFLLIEAQNYVKTKIDNRIVSVGYAITEIKPVILWWANAANWRKKSTRLGTTW